jgi:hypothetical protein
MRRRLVGRGGGGAAQASLCLAALFVLVSSCASSRLPPAISRSPSCAPKRVIPRCSADRAALSVAEHVAAESSPGQIVRIQGRLVPGAACCYGSNCTLSLGLLSAEGESLTPGAGPLVLLTALEGPDRSHFGAFDDPHVACAARFDAEGGPNSTHCCELDVSGQLVIASGPTTRTPSPIPPFRDAQVPGDMPTTSLPCTVSAPWRKDWSELRAIAVTDLCELR